LKQAKFPSKSLTRISVCLKRVRGAAAVFKTGLHYQSFCDHSRNFAWVNSKFWRICIRNLSGNCLGVKQCVMQFPQRSITDFLAHASIRGEWVFCSGLFFPHTHTHTLYLATLAPTTTKVDFHGGRRYKKYYKEYKKEGNLGSPRTKKWYGTKNWA
jgi:hypothetical protein